MRKENMGNMIERIRWGVRDGEVWVTAGVGRSIMAGEEALVVGIRMVRGGGVGV